MQTCHDIYDVPHTIKSSITINRVFCSGILRLQKLWMLVLVLMWVTMIVFLLIVATGHTRRILKHTYSQVIYLWLWWILSLLIITLIWRIIFRDNGLLSPYRTIFLQCLFILQGLSFFCLCFLHNFVVLGLVHIFWKYYVKQFMICIGTSINLQDVRLFLLFIWKFQTFGLKYWKLTLHALNLARHSEIITLCALF